MIVDLHVYTITYPNDEWKNCGFKHDVRMQFVATVMITFQSAQDFPKLDDVIVGMARTLKDQQPEHFTDLEQFIERHLVPATWLSEYTKLVENNGENQDDDDRRLRAVLRMGPRRSVDEQPPLGGRSPPRSHRLANDPRRFRH
jgi:hypothetical protein